MILRRELAHATNACRAALAAQSSSQLRQLLRTKSHLMRRLLEEQSRLLLAIRSQPAEPGEPELEEPQPELKNDEEALLLSL
jgi:hypothetical protein